MVDAHERITHEWIASKGVAYKHDESKCGRPSAENLSQIHSPILQPHVRDIQRLDHVQYRIPW